jgi:hypothetical protein
MMNAQPAASRPRYLSRLRSAVRLLLPRRRSEIEKFFALPYAERVATVKHAYRHEIKKGQLGNWFEWDDARLSQEVARNFRPYFDVLLGYARHLKPRSILQLGSFTMTESQWLVADKFPGRIIASDYSAEHVAYLQKGFAGTLFDRVEFRVVDIENPKPTDFADVSMVVGLAVLSNIQPEGLDRFFAALAASPVECLLVGDMYVKSSLGIDPGNTRSTPMPNARNWNHPYLALGRKHGFDSFFLPDFTYSSFLEARGNFVIHRAIPSATHGAALADAMSRYIARQDGFWPRYVADRYAGLEATASD